MARRDRKQKVSNRNALVVAMARAKAAESGSKAGATKRLFGYSGPKVQGPKSPRKVGSWKVSRPSGTAAPRRQTSKTDVGPTGFNQSFRSRMGGKDRQLKRALISRENIRQKIRDQKALTATRNRAAAASSGKSSAPKRRTPPGGSRPLTYRQIAGLIAGPKPAAKPPSNANAQRENAPRPESESRGDWRPKKPGEVKPKDPVGARRYKPKPVRKPVKIGPRTEIVEGLIGPKTRAQAENSSGRAQVSRGARAGSPFGGAVPLARLQKEFGGVKPDYQGPQRDPKKRRPKKKRVVPPPQPAYTARRGPKTKAQSEAMSKAKQDLLRRPKQRKVETEKLTPSQKLARWQQRNRELDAYQEKIADGFSSPIDDRVDFNSDLGEKPLKTGSPISPDDADRGEARTAKENEAFDSAEKLSEQEQREEPRQTNRRSRKIKLAREDAASKDAILKRPRLIGGTHTSDNKARRRAMIADALDEASRDWTGNKSKAVRDREQRQADKRLGRKEFFTDQSGGAVAPEKGPVGPKFFVKRSSLGLSGTLKDRALRKSPKNLEAKTKSGAKSETDIAPATDKRQQLTDEIGKKGRYPAGTLQKDLKPGDLVRLPDGSSAKLVSIGSGGQVTVRQSMPGSKKSKSNLGLSGTLKDRANQKVHKRSQSKVSQKTVTRTGNIRNVRPAGGTPAAVTAQGSPRGVPWSYSKPVVFKQHGGTDGKNGPQKLTPKHKEQLDEALKAELRRHGNYTAMVPGERSRGFGGVPSFSNPKNAGTVQMPTTGRDNFTPSGNFGNWARSHGSGVTAVWDKDHQVGWSEDIGGNPNAGHPFKPDPAGPKNAAAAASGGSSRPGARGSLNTQLKTRVATKKTGPKSTPSKGNPRYARERGERIGRGAKLSESQKKQIVRGLRSDQGIGVQKASSARGAGITRKAAKAATKAAGPLGIAAGAAGLAAGYLDPAEALGMTVDKTASETNWHRKKMGEKAWKKMLKEEKAYYARKQRSREKRNPLAAYGKDGSRKRRR